MNPLIILSLYHMITWQTNHGPPRSCLAPGALFAVLSHGTFLFCQPAILRVGIIFDIKQHVSILCS
jgi:hypothetical protein